MRILLINVPHLSIGSRLAGEHLPPLGLLSIAGPLIDRGHEVKLLDAEFGPMSFQHIIKKSLEYNPALILMGHSGSTSAQPIISEIAKLIKYEKPSIKIVIGGVFPTYHWQEILQNTPQIDHIVCGEGEDTIAKFVNAVENASSLENINGIATRINGIPVKTPEAALIENLDDYRIAWELMGESNYTYWGRKKAVVIQFSRGCPYPCSYCGQSLFWRKWRHRSAQSLADEMEMLHKKYNIEVFNFADENPAADSAAWKEFLETLIRKKLRIILVGSIRADHIVRDAAHLHLYRKAGFERFLLGIENYNRDILEKIKKAASVDKDKSAIQLLRQHGIIAMATYVVGFGEERISDFYYSFKQLLRYDPDQIQLVYATPHRWTPYFEEIKHADVIQPDQRRWDYKHQVLDLRNMKPWQVLACVKLIEVLMQARPKALLRLFFHYDSRFRAAMRWYTNIGRRVWFHEIFQFFFTEKHNSLPLKLGDFWK